MELRRLARAALRRRGIDTSHLYERVGKPLYERSPGEGEESGPIRDEFGKPICPKCGARRSEVAMFCKKCKPRNPMVVGTIRDKRSLPCVVCGTVIRSEAKDARNVRCRACRKAVHATECVDCGAAIEPAQDRTKCDPCKTLYQRAKAAERQRKRRERIGRAA